MWAKFQQKILKPVVVQACQIFQIFRQITWFLRNNRALPLGVGFCRTWLVLSNYKKISL